MSTLPSSKLPYKISSVSTSTSSTVNFCRPQSVKHAKADTWSTFKNKLNEDYEFVAVLNRRLRSNELDITKNYRDLSDLKTECATLNTTVSELKTELSLTQKALSDLQIINKKSVR